MSKTVSIISLEAGINSCIANDPPINEVLSGDLRRLADVYGTLIYARLRDPAVSTIDVSQFSAATQTAVAKWVKSV
jgi:hypothetical protein